MILYVEDDVQSRDIMHLLLTTEMGLSQFTIFEDSANFMARVAALAPQPDLILLDIHMRPLTGFEMLALLRADARLREVPVVALTASVMNEEVQALKQAGFNGVIAKPIDLETFPAIIADILRGGTVWSIIA